MSVNSFGRLFRLTTWGESHGPAIGAVVDGCPPGISLDEKDIQPWLDRRRPGQSKFTTQRRETDQVRILSGVFDGVTTGTPISLVIDNIDARTKDYAGNADSYRPGHADFTYDAKYGVRDWRGGGRASARETAARVAAAAIARRVVAEVSIRAYLVELGGDPIDRKMFDTEAIDSNLFFCPDPTAAQRWERLLDETRKAGDSLGAVVECVAEGVPPGWGAPVYAKLSAELAGAMMSINAVKGVEIGEGFAAAGLRGSDNSDQMRQGAGGDLDFLSNRAGGILGGISTGQPIVVRVAFKPPASILKSLHSVDRRGENVDITTKGRHDPCVGIRGAAVVEAMMALVLADQKLLHRAQCGQQP